MQPCGKQRHAASKDDATASVLTAAAEPGAHCSQGAAHSGAVGAEVASEGRSSDSRASSPTRKRLPLRDRRVTKRPLTAGAARETAPFKCPRDPP